MKVTVTGVNEIDTLLGRIAPRQAVNIMRATLASMAKTIAKDASDYAPRDQGDLEENIKHKRMRGRPGLLMSAAYVQGGATGPQFYWRFLEHGQGPDGVEHAFFARATENYRRDARGILEREFVRKFEAALRRANKRAG